MADGTRAELRQYTDEIEDVRVLYFITALCTVIASAGTSSTAARAQHPAHRADGQPGDRRPGAHQ
ncbi:hypothetical protein ACIQNK_39475 [Streptomyces sp. NPDC091273]|uniref:hypothetical protein n=1 Tax=Streptomyces sp. NPDC091273 TaxID=3365982 RepID=UPI0037FC0D16